MLVRLENFGRENYADLISWIDSEETLMQFGGPLFTFPLTDEQLDISLSDPGRMVFTVVNNETNASIGHAEIYVSGTSAKLGRILIGDKNYRGKGLGQQIVHLLLQFTFSRLNKTLVELNVFDWNSNAIKCYETVGFVINPHIRLERKIKSETWIAINMTIHQSTYEMKNGSAKINKDSASI